MTQQKIESFPSGEVRIFRPDGGGVWRLVGHVRAPGDPATDDLVGTAEADMPARFEPVAEPEV